MTELQESPALEALIAQEKAAVEHIRRLTNEARVRLHLPTRDYGSLGAGRFGSRPK
jgi:hypothetical protein